MINKNSKTLREFSLRVTDKKGKKYDIRYGYDMSNKESGHYVEVSINGGEYSSSKETLAAVKSIGIPAITQLIDAIGRDVTGMPENGIEVATKLLETLENKPTTQKWNNLRTFFQIRNEREESVFNVFAEKYFGTPSHLRRGLLGRYITSRRVSFITNQKSLVKALRRLYWGVMINGKRCAPKTRGYLNNHPYGHYYKRDIDYIRKARVKLFSKVLNREYIPAN